MAYGKSQRRASKTATNAIAALAGVSNSGQSGRVIPSKFRRSKRSPKLPQGSLTSQKESHLERLVAATEARHLARAFACSDNSDGSDDPIDKFNDLEDNQKKILIKGLLLRFGGFVYARGRHVPPADLHVYYESGLPSTDRAVWRGAPLRMADEYADEDMVPSGGSRPANAPTMIHGTPRWPPNLEISGNCQCSIMMDTEGRVDLEHDPYCLRRHFTTHWGVLKNQSRQGPPKPGAIVGWSDSMMLMRSGLCVDLKQASHLRCAFTKNTPLFDIISSPLLLYRIVANFGAQPFTEGDSYKSAWSFSFWNQEDATAYLSVGDHKGWPRAYFVGSEKASNQALQLLQWLASTNCPHSYDYTPCGVSA